jgi:uncharacterized protein
MKRYQPWLGARMTVHLDTVADLAQNVQYLHDLGINQFIFGPASGVDWTAEALAVYEAQVFTLMDWYRRLRNATPIRLRITSFEIDRRQFFAKRDMWGCRAGRQSLTVYTNGNIYPCSKMLGVNDQEGLYHLGHVSTGITASAAREELAGLVQVQRQKCEACEYRDHCTGGCFAVNCADTGSIFDPSPWECKLAAITRRIVDRYLALEDGVSQTDAAAS